ncbi:RepA [Rhodobacteraceae bacterium HTCC2083]|nr:RepA [Rhodobacteraceae bacterium HTCC2083]
MLTLSTDYFRLRKPLERRIYELARKHCGRQKSWRVSVEVLLKKSGSASPRRVFRKMIRDMIAADHLPDYEMSEEEGDLIRFTTRDAVLDDGLHLPPLSNEAIEAARALALGMDIYVLEAEWREYWARSGKPRLRSADAAFVGFVKVRHNAGKA